MTGKDIFGMLVLVCCGWGSGALFCGIGAYARRSKRPMGFWAGKEIDPKTISDIPAYNRACARLWKRYSIPYWLAGLIGFLMVIDPRVSALTLIPLGFGCTFGLWWLIKEYKKIEKKYKISV